MLLPKSGVLRKLTMINGMFTTLSGLKSSSQQLQNSANSITKITSIIQVNIQGEILPTINSIDEKLNAGIVKEVTGQISTQAAFSSNAGIIERADEIIGSMLNIKSWTPLIRVVKLTWTILQPSSGFSFPLKILAWLFQRVTTSWLTNGKNGKFRLN